MVFHFLNLTEHFLLVLEELHLEDIRHQVHQAIHHIQVVHRAAVFQAVADDQVAVAQVAVGRALVQFLVHLNH